MPLEVGPFLTYTECHRVTGFSELPSAGRQKGKDRKEGREDGWKETRREVTIPQVKSSTLRLLPVQVALVSRYQVSK